MKVFTVAFLLMVPMTAGNVLRAQSPTIEDTPGIFDAVLQAHSMPEAAGPALTLEEAEKIALAENPEIEVAVRRIDLAKAHVPLAGALDDPMAMYRGWGVPLKQPWNYNAAQNMFSISQALQGRGKQAQRTNIAESDVDEAKAELDQARLDVRVKVRKAFDDLLRVEDELRVHDDHLAVARQAIGAARIKYTVGKVPQQDMLKAQVTMTRLAEHMVLVDQDADLARGRLNTLLGRDPDAPLNVTGEHPVMSALPTLKTLENLAVQSRPDLAAAGIAAERSHKEEALAKMAYVPDFTVAAGYMVMPSGTNMRNDYMVEGTMNIPWLNRRKHDAEIAESKVKVTEQDAELNAMRREAFGQIQEALVETRSSQKLALMYEEQLRPQAEAALQSSVIAYENGKTDLLDLLDSQMTVVEIDQARLQAVADFDTHLADLELATGSSLDQTMLPAAGVK